MKRIGTKEAEGWREEESKDDIMNDLLVFVQVRQATIQADCV